MLLDQERITDKTINRAFDEFGSCFTFFVQYASAVFAIKSEQNQLSIVAEIFLAH
jgi:hypothetical protein